MIDLIARHDREKEKIRTRTAEEWKKKAQKEVARVTEFYRNQCEQANRHIAAVSNHMSFYQGVIQAWGIEMKDLKISPEPIPEFKGFQHPPAGPSFM